MSCLMSNGSLPCASFDCMIRILFNMNSKRKAYFYFWTSISEDDNVLGRIKGIAGIIWRVHKPPLPSPDAAALLSQIWLCVPIRISAYHVCYGPREYNLQSLDRFSKMSLVWFRNKNFMRYCRAHYGDAIEIMYTMMQVYGIPAECFPINSSASAQRFRPLEFTNVYQNGNMIDNSETAPLFHVHAHKVWMEHRISCDQQKRQLRTSLTSSRGSASATSILSSLRHSNGSSTMNDLMNLLRSSNGSMSADQFLNESIDPINDYVDLDEGVDALSATNNDTSVMGSEIDTSNFSNPSNGVPLASIVTGTTMDLFAGDDTNAFDNYLNESQTLSEALTSIPANEIPPSDIKFGRGRPLQYHAGNIWFRNLIFEEFERYERASKPGKIKLSKQIVQRVRSEGKQFWKKAETKSDRWIEVTDDDVVREKVAITFRTERKKVRNKRSNRTNTSSEL